MSVSERQNTVTIATNLGRGGVCGLILRGSESILATADYALSTVQKRNYSLKNGELLYGRITDPETGQLIDEVVMAATSNNQRIITGHGGTACTLALLNYYTNSGFTEAPCYILETEKNILQKMLSTARTDRQTVEIIQAIKNNKEKLPVKMTYLQDLLRPRTIAIAGAPNAGKSSLLNRLCGYERVMVSDIAGTTRDAVRDYININGYFTHLIDTAGFRRDASTAEQEAINKGREIITTADLVLFIFDSSRPLNNNDFTAIKALKSIPQQKILPLYNKCDLPAKLDEQTIPQEFRPQPTHKISCTTAKDMAIILKIITKYFQKH